MHYFDTRLNRTLMENRLEEAKRDGARRRRPRIEIPNSLKERIGAWMIIQGEKLANSTPKMA